MVKDQIFWSSWIFWAKANFCLQEPQEPVWNQAKHVQFLLHPSLLYILCLLLKEGIRRNTSRQVVILLVCQSYHMMHFQRHSLQTVHFICMKYKIKIKISSDFIMKELKSIQITLNFINSTLIIRNSSFKKILILS